MSASSMILIGYFPKLVVPRPDWIHTTHIKGICSVSRCISGGPDDWVDRWTHNELGFYSTIAAAQAVVPPDQCLQYQLHAYRLLPTVWRQGEPEPITLPDLDIEPLSPDLRSLGFDAVQWSDVPQIICPLECSPLSCNSMADEIPVNEHCLLDDLAHACRVACGFSRDEKVEPGPYVVAEVLVRGGPGR